LGTNAFSKVKETSPEGFRRANPSKLRPWIERDLRAILGDDADVDIWVDYVVALLKTHELQSDEAQSLLASVLHDKAGLFAHELLCFARSPLNMEAYDATVQY
jgi:E3 ubiquitin-protein ligase Topors